VVEVAIETGTVTAINSEGFGFIAADRHAGEIWIRPRSSPDQLPLREGQRVEYTIRVGELGIEAANVRPIGS
jgi:cold shock CspA family protein